MKPIILCVDDEKVILLSLKAQLKSAFGEVYRFELAESAAEALELVDELILEKECVVIVLTDWLMPEMKGDEFIVKLHHKHPNIIKIMLTGQADEEAIEKIYRSEAIFRCLKKPWSEQDLVDCIKAAIQQ